MGVSSSAGKVLVGCLPPQRGRVSWHCCHRDGGAVLQPRRGGRQGWAPLGWEQTRGLSPIPRMQILGILQSPQRSRLLAEPLLWVGVGTGTGR